MNVGLCFHEYGETLDGDTTHMAATLYAPETSLAWSTSHLRKFTFVYCRASASYAGAIARHGPHLCIIPRQLMFALRLMCMRTMLHGNR